MHQHIRLFTAPDGVRLAAATSGDGFPLVKAANWLSHLEFDLESDVWRHWWRELAADRLLVRYDTRGTGLSQRTVDDVSFEARVLAFRQAELLRSDARPAAHGRAGLDQSVPRAGGRAVMSRIRMLIAAALSLTGGATAP